VQFLLGLGNRPIHQLGQLVCINMQTLLINVMSKKSHLWLEEGTFLELDVELVSSKKREDDVEMLEVVFYGSAEDENIIQIDNHECV